MSRPLHSQGPRHFDLPLIWAVRRSKWASGVAGSVGRQNRLPADAVAFIQDCVRKGKVLWTYHVNIRLAGRFIARETILSAVDTYQLVEAYPNDKYPPSYLVLAHEGQNYFHILFATDVAGDNVRVVTAYRPDRAEIEDDLKKGRAK